MGFICDAGMNICGAGMNICGAGMNICGAALLEVNQNILRFNIIFFRGVPIQFILTSS